MKYTVTKTYGHDRGFSCTFRQKDADSHCKYLHGYALGFKFVFTCDKLDERNWVYDFGNLSDLKERLEYQFDHTTIVAEDDLHLTRFEELENLGLIQLRVMQKVSVEMFAKFALVTANYVVAGSKGAGLRNVQVVSCEVSEHSGNSATAYWEEDGLWQNVAQ